VTDDRIVGWARELLKHDAHAFKQARSHFLRRPSAKHLHDVRVSARRLRSLCEDLNEALPRLHKRRLHRLIDLTGNARDAAVLRDLLRRSLEGRERHAARPLLRTLRARERETMRCIARTLKKLRLDLP
jgi:CHAD domain-containing protein